jgi:5-methylcytosine-specific restriction endonuclease McrA
MKHKNYSDLDLCAAVKSSVTFAQVLRKLNLKLAGGNYITVKQKIKKLNLDISHFTGQGHSKGRELGPKVPLQDYLSNKRRINSHALRLKLLKHNVFMHKCYGCHLTTWLDKPIPLELEHINGNNQDNSLNNLTLLCPNCHALTSTYRGKNKKVARLDPAVKKF